MRAVLAFAIGVLAFLGTAGPVAAQEGPGGRVLVAGVSLGCADFRGKPVQTYETSGLGDVARSTLYGRIPVITVDKEVMASLSGKLQIFFYLHECAHHVLGHMFAPQPSWSQKQIAGPSKPAAIKATSIWPTSCPSPIALCPVPEARADICRGGNAWRICLRVLRGRRPPANSGTGSAQNSGDKARLQRPLSWSA